MNGIGGAERAGKICGRRAGASRVSTRQSTAALRSFPSSARVRRDRAPPRPALLLRWQPPPVDRGIGRASVPTASPPCSCEHGRRCEVGDLIGHLSDRHVDRRRSPRRRRGCVVRRRCPCERGLPAFLDTCSSTQSVAKGDKNWCREAHVVVYQWVSAHQTLTRKIIGPIAPNWTRSV